MNNHQKIALAICCVILPSVAAAQQNQFVSTEQKVQLIELYTSQGCSSCPPADDLLNKLAPSDQLWKTFIPVAFHVDYWNYLGFSDIYSSRSASQRQRQHYNFGNISSVYTPGFIVAGNEWRGFFAGESVPKQTKQQVGRLRLQLDTSHSLLNMSFNNKSQLKPHHCVFALLGFDQNVQITAGENSGLNLQQSFSVLAFKQTQSHFQNGQHQCHSDIAEFKSLIDNRDKKHLKTALVGWINSVQQKPIQVTGGWLTGPSQ